MYIHSQEIGKQNNSKVSGNNKKNKKQKNKKNIPMSEDESFLVFLYGNVRNENEYM